MSASPGERSATSAPWRGVTAAIAATAIVVAIVTAVLLGRSDLVDAPRAIVVLSPVVGLSFVGTGRFAWRRRPESRYGVLMVLIGFAWLLPA